MWVRYDADRPQFMRAAITGPAGTPYESGVFVFDLFFPLDYPQVPPKVTFLTTGHGTVRFNPNLYADGKVCLSLLGTYEGPRWTPGGSLHQVLVSIQGMILGVSHPIYNEPGLGGFEHHEAGGGGHTWHVHKMAERCYDERVQVATIQVRCRALHAKFADVPLTALDRCHMKLMVLGTVLTVCHAGAPQARLAAARVRGEREAPLCAEARRHHVSPPPVDA